MRSENLIDILNIEPPTIERWDELDIHQKIIVNLYIDALLAEQIMLPIPIKPGREIVNQERQGAVTYQQELVRCGKEKCKCTNGSKHGPYWYAYYRKNGRTASKYIGKELREISILQPGN